MFKHHLFPKNLASRVMFVGRRQLEQLRRARDTPSWTFRRLRAHRDLRNDEANPLCGSYRRRRAVDVKRGTPTKHRRARAVVTPAPAW